MPRYLSFFDSTGISRFWVSLILFFRGEFILDPFSRGKICWDWFVIITILYNCFAIPYFISFNPALAATLLPVDAVTATTMIFDIYLTFRTAYLDSQGELNYDSRTIARRYMKGGSFWIDCVSSFPYFIFSLALPSGDSAILGVVFLKLPSVLRLHRLIFHPLLDQTFNSPSKRIFRLLIGWFLIAHVFACMFWFVGIREPTDRFWYTLKDPMKEENTNNQQKYIASLYWALLTMTTIGYGDIHADSVYERAYTCVVLMASAVIYAAVFGSIAYAVNALSGSIRRFQNLTDSIGEFNTVNSFPDHLRSKMLDYNIQIWNQTKGFHTNEVLQGLPNSVKIEILTHIYSKLIARVPFFRQCSKRFLEAIIIRLHTAVCLQGDYIFKEGDKSREMYFIRDGAVEVYMEDPITGIEASIARVEDSSQHPFFGEIALLIGETRTASVKAVKKCTFACLSQWDFFEVMTMFPDEEDSLREIAQQRLQNDIERAKAATVKRDLARRSSIVQQKNQETKSFMRMATLRRSSIAGGQGVGLLSAAHHHGGSSFNLLRTKTLVPVNEAASVPFDRPQSLDSNNTLSPAKHGKSANQSTKLGPDGESDSPSDSSKESNEKEKLDSVEADPSILDKSSAEKRASGFSFFRGSAKVAPANAESKENPSSAAINAFDPIIEESQSGVTISPKSEDRPVQFISAFYPTAGNSNPMPRSNYTPSGRTPIGPLSPAAASSGLVFRPLVHQMSEKSLSKQNLIGKLSHAHNYSRSGSLKDLSNQPVISRTNSRQNSQRRLDIGGSSNPVSALTSPRHTGLAVPSSRRPLNVDIDDGSISGVGSLKSKSAMLNLLRGQSTRDLAGINGFGMDGSMSLNNSIESPTSEARRNSMANSLQAALLSMSPPKRGSMGQFRTPPALQLGESESFGAASRPRVLSPKASGRHPSRGSIGSMWPAAATSPTNYNIPVDHELTALAARRRSSVFGGSDGPINLVATPSAISAAAQAKTPSSVTGLSLVSPKRGSITSPMPVFDFANSSGYSNLVALKKARDAAQAEAIELEANNTEANHVRKRSRNASIKLPGNPLAAGPSSPSEQNSLDSQVSAIPMSNNPKRFSIRNADNNLLEMANKAINPNKSSSSAVSVAENQSPANDQ